MLSPIDIHNKQHKAGRGYSKKEMDEFLEQLSEDYETLYKENRDLKEKLEKLSDGVQYYKSMEGTLQKALVLAEKTSKDTIEAANEKAELIIKEARFKAEQIINDGNSQFENLRQQCLTLVQQYNQFKLQFKQIAIKQIELFDSDFYEIYTNDFLSKLNESIDKQPILTQQGQPKVTESAIQSDNKTTGNTVADTKAADTPDNPIEPVNIAPAKSQEDISVKNNTIPDIVNEPTIELPPLGDTRKIKTVSDDMVTAVTNEKADTVSNTVSTDISVSDKSATDKSDKNKEEDDLESLIKDLRRELSSNVNDNNDKKSAFEFLD